MASIQNSIREFVIRRARNHCEYCLLSQETQVGVFSVDHVLPLARDGDSAMNNLAFACPRCNSKKWAFIEAVDPATGEQAPLFNPRRQAWNDHFRWSLSNPVLIEGRTAIGRATIAKLDMNSTRDVAVRTLHVFMGLHPSRTI